MNHPTRLYGVPSAYVGVNAMNASLQAKGRSDVIIRGRITPNSQQDQAQGAASTQKLWSRIDEQTAQVRRNKTSKYSDNFQRDADTPTVTAEGFFGMSNLSHSGGISRIP